MRARNKKRIKTMKTAFYAVTLLLFTVASTVVVAAISVTEAEANSDLLAKCHWYKQQAFKLKTDAAWKTYHDCMRGRL